MVAPPHRVLVVGDAMIDVVGAVAGTADEVCAAGHVLGDLRTTTGGTGVVAAVAARAAGVPEVGLWTSVGDDPAAATLRALLRREDVVDLLRSDPARPTGTVVCLEFTGQRLLVANPGANSAVSPGGPDPNVLEFARGTDVLYVSGYSLQFPERAAQVARLVDLVRDNGGSVMLDLVPHRIETVAPDLRRILCRTDVVIGEAHTMRRVYPPASLSESDHDVQQLADRIVEHHQLAVIRVSNDTELLATGKGERRWADTGYASAPPARRTGLLDRRAVRTVLRWWDDGR
jgi:sugar/nucleoside kinase (ribokinase family)